MDLNLFRVFDAIYQQRSLTKAAEVLRLTQPAISHALGRLRDQFDDPLFVRQGHTMQPTPVAKNIVGDIRQGLGLLEGSLKPKDFDPNRDERIFTLGLRDIMEGTMVPDLIRSHPNLKLRSLDIRRNQVSRSLASGDLDVVLDVWVPKGEDIEHQKLTEDRWVVLASKNNPVCHQPMNEETYLDAQHILVSGRRDGPSWVDYELDRQGMARKGSVRSQHYFPAACTAANSQLLLTITESYGRKIAKALDLQVLEMPFEIAPMEVHLFWHHRMTEDPGNQWLREAIIETF